MLTDPHHNSRHPSADARRLRELHDDAQGAFRALRHLGPAVSLFGSARTPESHPDYQLVREVARTLGQAGYAVITGGGGGLMEAANRGALDVGADSVGLAIRLPHEQRTNPYVRTECFFAHFAIRKLVFVRYAAAFVAAPGGLGTLDELFECLTLIQTQVADPFPVLLLGSEYWQGLLDWLAGSPTAHGALYPGELSEKLRLAVVDTPAQVLAALGAPAGV